MEECYYEKVLRDYSFEPEPKNTFSFNPKKVYIVLWSEFDNWGIEKVFYSYDKAERYIEFRDKMTGCTYVIEEKDVSDTEEF